MTITAEIPNLERITFFSGQRLTAADLTALQRASRELRWLHNRSLHAWGIGAGLSVTGERGDTAVTVGPGYGLDELGREIILTESCTKTVPAVARGTCGAEAVYYLVAAYRADDEQRVAERRPGVCAPEGTVRLSEEPLLDWRRPDQLKEGLELIIAQAWIQNCQLSRPLSWTARHMARLSQAPYIASGQTEVGDTAWKPWLVEGQVAGVFAQVDTSAARFRTVPTYAAHIGGDRFLAAAPGPLLAVGFAAVVEPTPDGLRCGQAAYEPVFRVSACADGSVGCVASHIIRRSEPRRRIRESSRRRDPVARHQLTAQELQIPSSLRRALSNRDIGQRLYLSHHTIGTHPYHVFPKLGITGRGEPGLVLSDSTFFDWRAVRTAKSGRSSLTSSAQTLNTYRSPVIGGSTECAPTELVHEHQRIVSASVLTQKELASKVWVGRDPSGYSPERW